MVSDSASASRSHVLGSWFLIQFRLGNYSKASTLKPNAILYSKAKNGTDVISNAGLCTTNIRNGTVLEHETNCVACFSTIGK